MATATVSAPAETPTALLSVKQLADLVNCSTRHIYRLVDAGRMPPPVRLGALVRWSRPTIEAWIADGCPSFRKGVTR
jgi:excisionase family DNA binding protein